MAQAEAPKPLAKLRVPDGGAWKEGTGSMRRSEGEGDETPARWERETGDRRWNDPMEETRVKGQRSWMDGPEDGHPWQAKEERKQGDSRTIPRHRLTPASTDHHLDRNETNASSTNSLRSRHVDRSNQERSGVRSDDSGVHPAGTFQLHSTLHPLLHPALAGDCAVRVLQPGVVPQPAAAGDALERKPADFRRGSQILCRESSNDLQ
eukprot:scaffold2858_cov659-Pavlova_lutheri.AAC.230